MSITMIFVVVPGIYDRVICTYMYTIYPYENHVQLGNVHL